MITQYTFTFNISDKARFLAIRSLLDPDEFTIVSDIADTSGPYAEYETTMKMDPEAAATFRFGMVNLKIKRLRTDDEIEAEAAEAVVDESNDAVVDIFKSLMKKK
jgi:hypothetical protein